MALRTFEISIITPFEATNLVTNPTPTVDLTGYTAFTSTLTRVTTYSRRGIASIQVAAAAAPAAAGLFTTVAVTNGVNYTVSCDVLDAVGMAFTFQIYNAALTRIYTSPTFAGNGAWKRRSFTFAAQASETYRVYLIRSANTDATPYYVDGWQIEAGAEPTTYIDGDQTGFVSGETAYRWNGARGASTSWRSGQTRSGGKMIKLSTYAKIISIIGMGMTSVTNIGVPSTMGRGYYQTTINNERDFSIICNINKTNDYALVEKARAGIIAAVNPDLVAVKQPLLMQVDQLDAAGLEIAETLQLPCHYQGGLEMDGSGNAYNERVSLNFHSFVPMFRQDGGRAVALGYQTSIANANYILQRNSSGVWAAMGTGAAGGYPFTFAMGTDGTLYAGGAFTSMGGVANTARIAKWNGSAWSALSTGMNGAVFALAVGPDGTLYAGGAFTLAAGVANTAYVAKWNGSAWSALGTGMNGTVKSLTFDSSGNLYAGGDFTLAGGVANTAYVAKWTGSAWSALSTGMNAGVNALAMAPDGTLYAGGIFTIAGGVSVINIARWNGTAWSSIGAVSLTGILSMAFDAAGQLYVGGLFDVAGGVNAKNIAVYNGSGWKQVGSGSTFQVNLTARGPDNTMIISGQPVGSPMPDDTSFWNGSTWLPLDTDLPGTGNASAALYDAQQGTLYLGYTTSGTATSATVTNSTASNTLTYPRITFTGPGTCYQVKNYTTGKSIYFNLTLQAGEVAVLDLDPYRPQFYSTWRGDLMATILPGSNLNFELLPGTNNISAFLFGGTSAATAVTLTAKDQYNGIDAAVR